MLHGPPHCRCFQHGTKITSITRVERKTLQIIYILVTPSSLTHRSTTEYQDIVSVAKCSKTSPCCDELSNYALEDGRVCQYLSDISLAKEGKYLLLFATKIKKRRYKFQDASLSLIIYRKARPRCGIDCAETTRYTTPPATFHNRAGLGYTIRVIFLCYHVTLEVDAPYLICTCTSMIVQKISALLFRLAPQRFPGHGHAHPFFSGDCSRSWSDGDGV